MDYKKIHDKFIKYFIEVDIYDRIKHRNVEDFRLDKSDIYTEIHHIIPKHSFRDDNRENLVTLLPEEHLFIHKLRWMAYKQRGDMLAVRFILNGLNNKKHKRIDNIKLNLTKKLLQSYLWIKQNSAEVRKTHGWHTKAGLNNISRARMGKMPAKDINGISIGSVSINHPKVISGEWVHTTKGRKCSKEEASKHARHGAKNGRHSGLSDDDLIKIVLDITKELNRIPSRPEILRICKEKNIKFLTSFSKCRFGGKGIAGLYSIVEELTGLIYNPYRRTKEMKDKISNSLKERHKRKLKETMTNTEDTKEMIKDLIRKRDADNCPEEDKDYYNDQIDMLETILEEKGKL